MTTFSTETFADKLPITRVEWQLMRWDEYSGLGTGEVLAAQLAPPRWGASVELAPMYHDKAAAIQALIEALDGPINNFYLYAPQKPFPRYDPRGEILGSASPVISIPGANNKSLSFAGMPSGYQLSAGDMFAVDYASNPTRRYLGRLVGDSTASGSGSTGQIEVRPHLPAGIAAALPVMFLKPSARVFILPNTFNPGSAQGLFTTGMSFEVMQRP